MRTLKNLHQLIIIFKMFIDKITTGRMLSRTQLMLGFFFFTFSNSSPALMASSVGTPSSSSSAVPSIDLFTCFIKALRKAEEKEMSNSCINCEFWAFLHRHTETHNLIDSVSMCTGAILSSRNLTISRNGLLGCLGLPSFLVMSR